ncbi:MAG: hypothetical protein ABWK53_08045 [Anaerolineales bacterium]
MKKILLPLLVLVVSSLVLSACGGETVEATPTLAPTATPDPCSSAMLPTTLAPVNALMREFDDAAQLAAQTPRDQLVQVIPSLQEIRRRAEDQQVPPCLATLRALQITHMNTVINTLMAFLSGADVNILVQGIAQARLQREDYNRELARLTGVTYEPAATATPASATPVATNTGGQPVSLYAVPAADTPPVGVLAAGQGAVAVGQSADGRWIQIISPDDPNQLVWLLAETVTLLGGESLPVVP